MRVGCPIPWFSWSDSIPLDLKSRIRLGGESSSFGLETGGEIQAFQKSVYGIIESCSIFELSSEAEYHLNSCLAHGQLDDRPIVA